MAPRVDAGVEELAPAGAEDVATKFFAMATDMLCVAGVDGYFKTLNPAWTRTLGYSTEELLAQPYLDFVHPDDRPSTIAEASKLADGWQTIHFRNRYKCKDGSYKWLAWSASPAALDGAIYAVARDVSTAVLSEHERENELEHLLEREASVRAVLDGEGLGMVFQPVVGLRTGLAAGFEALARFEQRPVRTPDVWFADADAVGLGKELELRAIAKAVECAAQLPDNVFLAVNVSPSTLVSEDLDSTLAQFDRERLVVEVTEHAAVADYEQLKEAIGRLRHLGVRLAIDDAGAGHSGLNQIVQLVPEFIKLDLFLTRNIDSDSVKRALATALVTFAKEIGATLIAEGVETADELRVLRELGIDNAQGYFLGRPAALPPVPAH
jgi:PAS domain S-box-containing protein